MVPVALCSMGYLPETHLKLKSCGVSFAHNLFNDYPIVLKFYTAVIPPCAMQQLKAIWQLKQLLWMNDISRDLSFDMSYGWIYHTAPLSI